MAVSKMLVALMTADLKFTLFSIIIKNYKELIIIIIIVLIWTISGNMSLFKNNNLKCCI